MVTRNACQLELKGHGSDDLKLTTGKHAACAWCAIDREGQLDA